MNNTHLRLLLHDVLSCMLNITNMAAETTSSSMEENSFTKPWNGSDVILVVQDIQLHVHKSILSLQSPVFRAMFNGQFKEATAEQVVLTGKTHKWILQFLRLLYPANMIKNGKVVISDENVFEILKLADEYQASNVISQCLAEITLTKGNVMQLLPYAIRYDESAVKRLNEKIGSSISAKALGERVQEFSDGKVARELLVSKGCHLESVLLKSCKVLKSLLSFIAKKNNAFSSKCGHMVVLSRFEDAVKCQDCVSVYRTNFVDVVANQILAPIEKSEAKELRVKIFGDLIMQALNVCVDMKG